MTNRVQTKFPVVKTVLARVEQLFTNCDPDVCPKDYWLSTHADYAANNTTFMFPIRVIAGALVGVLLMAGCLSTIDYLALKCTREILSLEQGYNEQIVPLLHTAYHNSYFESGSTLSSHSARPPFTRRDQDCPCTLMTIMEKAFKFGHKFLQLSNDPDPAHIESYMGRDETGKTIKCSVQVGREFWEPIPFCIRYAGMIAMLTGLVSTALFLTSFREQALQLHALVEKHFDGMTGWPKDPRVLSEDDVRLLTGGKTTWLLDYAYLSKLPSFMGLYCGNMVVAFLTHWVLWMLALYLLTCRAIPIDPWGSFVLILPLVLEVLIKRMLWKYIISPRQGILHPRLYAAADIFLAVMSAYTGPLKTLFRVLGANLCLLCHLFRSDVTMMLGSSFLPLDPHYKSTTGLLSALRMQYEFNKIRRTRVSDAGHVHVQRSAPDTTNGESFTTAEIGAAAFTTAITVETVETIMS
eukprot:COSAG01_NODE_6088_length_3860_cov_7.538421_4_plen_466_part_00